jgi:hypothetical protein
MMFLSIIILYLGILLNLERFISVLPSESYIILSFFLVVIGLIGIYYSIYHVNVFIEMGWQNHLEELYIIHKNSLKPLYHQVLKKSESTLTTEKENSDSENFFSGGLVGINDILKQISESNSKTKGISLVQEEGKFLLIEHGQDVMVCFVTDKNMNSLRYYLRKIRDAWETYYCTQPIDWSDTKQEFFIAMGPMVNQILQGEKI